ncbi:hypothetical protein MKW92_041030 [Papaver armeniacum]|nr:hypothetical protein MKW92_041030 [Papaver armeniacum]
MIVIRVRSRDGSERIQIENPNITVSQLKTLIESQFHVPISQQTISLNKDLLLAKSPQEKLQYNDLSSNPQTLISSLGISHGSEIFLSYEGERSVVGGPKVTPAGSFGRKMTMDDLIAKQMRVSRQEKPNCESVSFDRDAANCFQHYVNETLAFVVKRGGFMYGTVSEDGEVMVNFIYEMPQQGTEENLVLMRDTEEEKIVEAIATGLGMRRVGFIFTQTIGQSKKDYTLSNSEVLQAAELHGESGLKEWVTALVKLEVNEEGGADVHFEAFQMSDICVKLFKEGWFETDCGGDYDPKISRMKKEVVVGVKDVKEGPLSTSFPVENRITSIPSGALKTHLDKAKSLPFVRRISDFHLLLLLSRFFDVNSDVPALCQCVQLQSTVPEGYQLLIESMASAT